MKSDQSDRATRCVQTQPAESMLVSLQGFPMRLLVGRGVHLADQDTLLVADLHLGKDADFRRQRIPVPEGSSGTTLRRVASMIRQTCAVRVVFLGDVVHSPAPLSSHLRQDLDGFFDEFDQCEFCLTRGNHDREIESQVQSWPIKVVPSLRLGDITLSHHPPEVLDASQLDPKSIDQPAGRLSICGHVHPSFRPRSLSDQVGRLPCFLYRLGCLVLPAVGDFTGTHRVSRRPGDRIWVIADNQVIEIQK